MKVSLVSYTTFHNSNMSFEEGIINIARMSSPENRDNHSTHAGLLRFLIKAKHWSPFEQGSIGVTIQTSRAIGAQLLRHRSFTFQEFSQRYAAVADIEPVELRYQATKNRQSSTDVVGCQEINSTLRAHMEECKKVYDGLLQHGVAKECARFVLPMAASTTIAMNGTLRSWIHFLEQRCDPHAQKEIRLIALEIRKVIHSLCPVTAESLGWPIEL